MALHPANFLQITNGDPIPLEHLARIDGANVDHARTLRIDDRIILNLGITETYPPVEDWQVHRVMSTDGGEVYIGGSGHRFPVRVPSSQIKFMLKRKHNPDAPEYVHPDGLPAQQPAIPPEATKKRIPIINKNTGHPGGSVRADDFEPVYAIEDLLVGDIILAVVGWTEGFPRRPRVRLCVVREVRPASYVAGRGETPASVLDERGISLDGSQVKSVARQHGVSPAPTPPADHGEEAPAAPAPKTLSNTTASQAKDNVRDLKTWGTPDVFKLISKASSESEGWMKSTKAMQIPDVGCLVQVTTQQRGDDGSSAVAEALSFVPGVCLCELTDERDTVVSRKLVKL